MIKRKTSFHTGNRNVKCPYQLVSERKWVRKRKTLSRKTTAIKSPIYIFIENQVYNFLKCLKKSYLWKVSSKATEEKRRTRLENAHLNPWHTQRERKKGGKIFPQTFKPHDSNFGPFNNFSFSSVCSYSKRSGSRPQIHLLWAGGLNLHLLYQRLSHELGNTFREKLNFFYDFLIPTKIVICHFRGAKTVLIATWYLYPEFKVTHQRNLWLN